MPSNNFQTRLTATLAVKDWDRAIEFYKAAFGACELFRPLVRGRGHRSAMSLPCFAPFFRPFDIWPAQFISRRQATLVR